MARAWRESVSGVCRVPSGPGPARPSFDHPSIIAIPVFGPPTLLIGEQHEPGSDYRGLNDRARCTLCGSHASGLGARSQLEANCAPTGGGLFERVAVEVLPWAHTPGLLLRRCASAKNVKAM